MMFHASFSAKNPEHAAKVIAELWGGEAIPFLPIGEGCWMALCGDDRNTMIEMYPYPSVLSHDDPRSVIPDPDPTTTELVATHIAIGTVLTAEEVLAIGEREGWAARRMHRKMGFDVVELWVENRVMLEVLTKDMQADYLETTTTARWLSALEKWKELQAAGKM